MGCDDLSPFIDGELPPERAAEFRAHLKVCAACQRDFPFYTALDARLRQLGKKMRKETP